MPREIERKFLVAGDYKTDVYTSKYIVQAYISSNPNRTVRIRILGNKSYITIKGRSTENGLNRYEWEKEINLDEAEELLLLCEENRIEKIRHYARIGDFVYEVDEFLGCNAGLVIAELELESGDAEFIKPTWLGREVTGESKYYNSSLIRTPFSSWSNSQNVK